MIKAKARKNCIRKMKLRGTTEELMIELITICVGTLISLAKNATEFEQLKDALYNTLENVDYHKEKKEISDK